MIEIKFFQIEFMPRILRLLEKKKNKIIIFCDDFSFECNDEKFILYKIGDFSGGEYPHLINFKFNTLDFWIYHTFGVSIYWTKTFVAPILNPIRVEKTS